MTANADHRARAAENAHALLSLDRLPAQDQLSFDETPQLTRTLAEVTSREQAPRPILTVAEAAELLGVSRWLVHQQIARGVLPCVRLGRRILIPRTRLLAWLESGP